MSAPEPRIDAARLAEIAAGETPSVDEARRLLAEDELRRQLAGHDPSAVFAVLGALPLDPPAPPRPAPALWPARSSRRSLRLLLAAASVLVAVAGLVLVGRAPLPGRDGPAAAITADAAEPRASWPAAVERVGSPTARIVTLVPPAEGGPVVTLILDDGVEL
ncbi:MAG: hypothetical protein D6738_03570 [Acidobacteria bacterium]|nr:MAG: hypothetical protein D6738_03570 [Acidobacteriota bacterium]